MITVQETTKSFEPHLLHTYFLSDDKLRMYGYIPNGESQPKMASTPLTFSPKGRTFKKLKV